MDQVMVVVAGHQEPGGGTVLPPVDVVQARRLRAARYNLTDGVRAPVGSLSRRVALHGWMGLLASHAARHSASHLLSAEREIADHTVADDRTLLRSRSHVRHCR